MHSRPRSDDNRFVSTNQQMTDYIPLEVQEEIIKMLPTKTLMRFRSVSKPWKSLIDSPKFIADYSFNHSHQQHLLVGYFDVKLWEQKYVSFVDDDTFPLEKVSLHDPIPRPNHHTSIRAASIPTILGSSQGLLCLYNCINTVHLWNPSIRKSIAIDVSHVVVPHSRIDIGFGVCPHTHDPKLVMINSSFSFRDEGTGIYTPCQVEVYTLSSRAWRSIPISNLPCKKLELLLNHVVINEFIYWLAIDALGDKLIVSFDLTTEGFMEVSLPDACVRCRNMAISKIKESLVVVKIVEEAEKQVYGVWMMEDGASNSFAKLYTINSPDASIECVLGFWKNNEPIFATKPDFDVCDVFIHELQSEHINYIAISGKGYSYCAHSYMETLLLLDH